ncbi:MAG: DUF4157 domain-containing protein [Candidatus Bathyarchaeota archaeon]|nr:DUF4157 domain-containing protein [Candidatus Termitimicrobium sp.]
MFAYEAKKESQQKQQSNFNINKENVLQLKIPHTSPRNGCMLPSEVRGQLEKLTGFSFADVQVYYNSAEPAKIEAYAYVQGNKVYIGPGQEHHLLHELGHVIQQKKGIVKPTAKLNGVDINDDPRLEQEADNILNMSSPQNTEKPDMLNSTVPASSVIQRNAYLRSKPLDVINTIRDSMGNIVANAIEAAARRLNFIPRHYHIFFDSGDKNLPTGLNNNIGYTIRSVNAFQSSSGWTVTGPGALFQDPSGGSYSDEMQISDKDSDQLVVDAINAVGLLNFGTYNLWSCNCQTWTKAVVDEYVRRGGRLVQPARYAQLWRR